MPLSHTFNDIYSTEEYPMDAINATLQKGEVPKKGETPKKGESLRKKRVQNVQTEEVKAQTEKFVQKPNELPRKVTFKTVSHPTKHDQQIVVDDDATYARKSKN